MKNAASNPSRIAREVLLRLASNKMAPTPVNYRQFYDEIAGIADADKEDTQDSSEDFPGLQIFSRLIDELPRESTDAVCGINELQGLIARKDWGQFKNTLTGLLARGIAGKTSAPAASIPATDTFSPAPEADKTPVPEWADLISILLKQLDNKQTTFTSARKRESLNRVLLKFGADPEELYTKLQALVTIWTTPPLVGSKSQATIEIADSPAALPFKSTPVSDQADQKDKTDLATEDSLSYCMSDNISSELQNLLAQALERGVADHLTDVADLAEEARMIAMRVRNASGDQALPRLTAQLGKFYSKLALHHEDRFKTQQALVRLFHLLMDNVSELAADNQWLNGQITAIREMLSTTPDLQMIIRAERSLREMIIKNSIIQTDLENARTIIKHMVTGLITNIQGLSETTSNYTQKVEGYLEHISDVQNQEDLVRLMTVLVAETKHLQSVTINSHNDLIIAQSAAKSAEDRINRLEAELREMSDKAREDPLTGILNRHGLQKAYERAANQSDQRNTSLCVCLIDIDNFKTINDTYGHQTGDETILFMVRVIQETIRPTDIIARYGGEEFLLLLPDAGMNEAVNVATRIQHNLSQRFFVNGEARIQITFSAGVTKRCTGESLDDVVTRSDKALYGAKHAGKNRVFTAELVTS